MDKICMTENETLQITKTDTTQQHEKAEQMDQQTDDETDVHEEESGRKEDIVIRNRTEVSVETYNPIWMQCQCPYHGRVRQ